MRRFFVFHGSIYMVSFHFNFFLSLSDLFESSIPKTTLAALTTLYI